MALYTNGIANNPDDLFQQMRAHLTANGWTEHDVINDVLDNRDIVFKGTELTTGIGNAPLVRVRWNGTNYSYVTYTDWDATNNAGANLAGDLNNASFYWQVSTAPFNFWMRANGLAFCVVTEVSTVYRTAYAGFYRRVRGTAVDGITSLSAAASAGASTVSVTTDVSAKMRVGQQVFLIDRSGSNASATWQNVEKLTIQSVTATTITFTSALTKGYSAGSFVGTDPYPISCAKVPITTIAFNSSVLYVPIGLGGGSSGSNGTYLPLATNTKGISYNYADDDPSALGERGIGGIVVAQTGVSSGFRGFLYHLLSGAFQTANAQDLIDEGDGVTDAVILRAANDGFAMLRG